MGITSDFKAQFYKEYNNGILDSSKTTAKIDFFVFEGKTEIMNILFPTGSNARIIFEDFGNIAFIKIFVTIEGDSFKSKEDDICVLCNVINRNLKLGKATLNEDSLLHIDKLYFVNKSSFFDSAIACIKNFMDIYKDIILICEQYGESTLV